MEFAALLGAESTKSWKMQHFGVQIAHKSWKVQDFKVHLLVFHAVHIAHRKRSAESRNGHKMSLEIYRIV